MRVDVAGGIGGTGVLAQVIPQRIGHTLYLKPYIFFENNIPEVRDEKDVTIDTAGAPTCIYPLGKTLKQFVKDYKPLPTNHEKSK